MQFSAAVLLYAYDAMAGVDAWVDGLDGLVDAGAFDVAAEDVVSHLEWYDLLVVEDVLDYDDAAEVVVVGVFVESLVFLGVA